MRKRGQERVLLTGATGFIGRKVAERLLDAECNVHLLIRPGSDKSRLYSLKGEPILQVHDGTMAGMLKVFRAAEPDTVVHLAGVTLPDHKAEDVDSMLQANILLGAQLVEASARHGAQRFINTGTYWQYFRRASYDPVCLYAATKQAFEDILRFYTETTTLRTVTLALYDVYGPGDPRDKLLAQLERARRTGETLTLTPGRQLIDPVHVDDVADAFLHAMRLLTERSSEIHGKTYAVRTGAAISVRQFVSLYTRLTQANLEIDWGGRPYRPRTVMSPWEGPILPGWKAKVSLEQGIKDSVAMWTPKLKAAHGG